MSAALKSAIESNDSAAVREAIDSVKDINAKLFDGQTAVALACKLGADQALAALLEAKAKVQGKHYEDPFVIAADLQHLQTMQLLFDRKRVPGDAMENALFRTIREGRVETLQFILRQFKPPVTMTEIMVAGQYRQPAIIRALAAAGTDLNMQGTIQRKRTSALHPAVRTGDIETILAMVECGASLNARDDWGVTPLMELADGGSEIDRQVAGYLQYQETLQRRAQEQPDRAQEILNSPAAKQPRPPSAEDALRALLDFGADATLKDDEGNDALDCYRFQCRRSKQTPENPKVVELLRTAGATGDAATFNLFEAIAARNLDGVRQAIAAGADVNRINPAHGSENTPLIEAVISGNLDLVNALLEAKADPNKPERMDRPLLEACRQGDVSIVQRLIEAGADVSLRHLHDLADDCPAMNAFETAQWASKKEAIKYLKSIGADKVAQPNRPEAGVHSWDDFAEVLAKGDVPTIASVIAKMIDGKIQTDVYEKTITPGKRAYLIVRPIGMAWCNVFQLAPAITRLEEMSASPEFAGELCAASAAPVLFIGYSDTSDAAMSIRFEPGKKPKQKNGKESDNDWLVNLAKKEQFMVAAFGLAVESGKPIEIIFSGFSAEAFDGIAYVSA